MIGIQIVQILQIVVAWIDVNSSVICLIIAEVIYENYVKF